MRRLLMAAVALALPITGILAFAGVSAAATTVKCTKLSGKENGNGGLKGTLTGCNDPKNTGGKGKFKGSTLSTSTTASITWNGTGTTTFTGVTFSPTYVACPGGSVAEKVTGTVSGGTGEAAKSIPKDWTFRMYLCIKSSNAALSLAPGTDFLIGAKY
jgi:hypothetical protein